MKLSIFFEPLPEDYTTEQADSQTVGAAISCFTHKFPNWRNADIAIIGVDEHRGSSGDNSGEDGLYKIRKQLYRLKKGSGRYRIVDLGDLMPGMELEDTYLRLQEVVEALISHNTIPIIIGGSHDLSYGQFLAYEALERHINLVMIDSEVDMSDDPEAAPKKSHLHRMLMHDPNYLFSFSQIGHQQYLVAQEVLTTLEKLHFEAIRVGEVHQNFKEMEPVVRQADLLSFDISAIRFQDAPGYAPANPFGLTGEQACQLCWYAGTNDHLSSFGIYEYEPSIDVNNLCSATIATMIWYFIEGFYHRKNETDFNSNHFVKYAIGFQDNPHKMMFYKSKNSERWWLEVEGFSENQSSRIVPCSYEDYLTAVRGEVPNRWILTQGRMG